MKPTASILALILFVSCLPSAQIDGAINTSISAIETVGAVLGGDPSAEKILSSASRTISEGRALTNDTNTQRRLTWVSVVLGALASIVGAIKRAGRPIPIEVTLAQQELYQVSQDTGITQSKPTIIR